MDCGVKISENYWGLGFVTEVEVSSSYEVGFHLFAMAAPRGEKFDKDVLIVIKNLLEVVICKLSNTIFVLYFSGDGRSS